MTKKIRVFKDPFSSACYFPGGEEARARFKYHSFLQDYCQLQKETEEKRVRLAKALQMKLQLLAEVKFLRRKCHQFSTTPGTVTFKFKQDSHKIPSPFVPQHLRSQKSKPIPPQTSIALLDLNEVFLPLKSSEPLAGKGMEGFKGQRNPENEGGLKRSLREGGEASASDVMLSICRGSGIGLNRVVGKRKVSWQDQLALRV